MASGGSSKTEFLVNGKYRLVRKIGSGSFGDIYLGINISNGEVSDEMWNVFVLRKKSRIIILKREIGEILAFQFAFNVFKMKEICSLDN